MKLTWAHREGLSQEEVTSGTYSSLSLHKAEEGPQVDLGCNTVLFVFAWEINYTFPSKMPHLKLLSKLCIYPQMVNQLQPTCQSLFQAITWNPWQPLKHVGGPSSRIRLLSCMELNVNKKPCGTVWSPHAVRATYTFQWLIVCMQFSPLESIIIIQEILRELEGRTFHS